MFPTFKLSLLLSLGLLSSSFVGAAERTPSLRVNKKEEGGLPKRAEEVSNRLLSTVHQASAARNPQRTKEAREAARHHTAVSSPDKHSTSSSRAGPSNKNVSPPHPVKEDKFEKDNGNGREHHETQDRGEGESGYQYWLDENDLQFRDEESAYLIRKRDEHRADYWKTKSVSSAAAQQHSSSSYSRGPSNDKNHETQDWQEGEDNYQYWLDENDIQFRDEESAYLIRKRNENYADYLEARSVGSEAAQQHSSSSYSRGPSSNQKNHVAPAKKGGDKSKKAGKDDDEAERFDYFKVDEDYINSIDAAPVFDDTTPNGSGVCNGNDHLVEMVFTADQYSKFENEVVLIKDVYSEGESGAELIWDYPIGSFKETFDDIDGEGTYYFRACVCPTKCNMFTFVDTDGELECTAGGLALRVNGNLAMKLHSGGEGTGYMIEGRDPDSVDPYKYVLPIGDCV